MITPTHYMLVGMLLFIIGAATVVTRRHPLLAVLGIEIMLQAVNLVLAALTGWFQDWEGEMAMLAVTALAAVELAVGLAVTVVWRACRGKPVDTP